MDHNLFLGAEAEWSPAPSLEAGVAAGWTHVDARDNVAIAESRGPAGSMKLGVRW